LVVGLVVGTLAASAVLGGSGTSAAVPPPPPNPSDSDLTAGRAAADAKAGEVGQLANQLAAAETRLSQLQGDVELKQEQANKAMVDLQTAQDAASEAQAAAAQASADSDAAEAGIEAARVDLDNFVSASYQQGSMLGSISAYLGSRSPQDLLDRVELLSSLSGSQLNAIQLMEQARTEKANKDAAAREAMRVARQREDDAAQAQRDADAARAAAEQAQRNQSAETARLETQKDQVEHQLFAAQQQVAGLEGQRQRYQDWLAQKQRDDEAAARRVALTPSTGGGGAHAVAAVSGPAASVIEQVVARAMSQLGVSYAWGGGNAYGPTLGIHDGGVADDFGDYRKVGFDCSGLMVYAFSGVVSLPHYSGYQYTAGRQVPLSQMRRGDLLFWGPDIHHVALYLGDGMMIEAPESGMVVRVTPVRYGGIMPYATRLVG
jgi:peptidoglycan DL-endopeptidase RipA